MRAPPLPFVLLVVGAAALACGDPVGRATPDVADVRVPPPPEERTEQPPPGGWIADGVIYDKDGSVYGCVGGGNACAGPPAGMVELDLCGDVDAIRDAALDARDRTGKWKPVTPTPRAVDALDESAVAWPKGSGFAAIGWAPEGPTRATYWIVTPAAGGIEVHGLARVKGGWQHCFATDATGAVDVPWRGG